VSVLVRHSFLDPILAASRPRRAAFRRAVFCSAALTVGWSETLSPERSCIFAKASSARIRSLLWWSAIGRSSDRHFRIVTSASRSVVRRASIQTPTSTSLRTKPCGSASGWSSEPASAAPRAGLSTTTGSSSDAESAASRRELPDRHTPGLTRLRPVAGEAVDSAIRRVHPHVCINAKRAPEGEGLFQKAPFLVVAAGILARGAVSLLR
jgi:hypothetical protein